MTKHELPTESNRWGLDPIYNTKFTDWSQLESAISAIENTKRRGDAFEQFSYFYLLYHKDLYDIDEVWCDKIKGRSIPNKVRDKYKLEKKDYGVDGACRLRSNKFEAWQSKFRSNRAAPTYTELSTFWAEAEYADSRRIISNSRSLPPIAQKKLGHQQILVDNFLRLHANFFEALFSFATEIGNIRREKYAPRSYQKLMITNVVSGLIENNRGKLIAAPGTGKTLVALWIIEDNQLEASKVLVLVPSIALVGQTLRQWTMHRNKDFSYLCVCSDQTIDSEALENYDIRASELGFQVTTSVEEIKTWLETTSFGRQYIFSTYQSIEVIEQAMKELHYEFDIIVFDEAHRTVGREGQLFATALKNERIPSKKRLFMTATERILNPRIRTLAINSGVEVFSMCDESIYGPTFHEYKFGQAIRDGVIADYEIVLAEVTSENVKSLMEVNRLLSIETKQEEIGAIEITADQLFKAAFLVRALEKDEVSKVITFHFLRNRAKRFSKLLTILSNEIRTVKEKSPYVSYILGDQSSADRSERIASFENSEIGILSNVQVLSEGVDIPLIDSVYFVDPKSSVIDIVQAIGRALRKPFGEGNNKIARIIVPVLVSEEVNTLEDIDWDITLQTFHYVIQAMRAQDKRLEEEVNQINLYETTNGKNGRRVGFGGRIRIDAPAIDLMKKIDLNTFLNKINLRIATANANPDGSSLGFSFLGKGQRKSEYKPMFSIFGDYNPEVYYKKLVKPTINKFQDMDMRISSKNLKINHNNVSHTTRLGLIQKSNGQLMHLTTLGRKLWNKEITFNDVLKNQMMLYSTKEGLFPYRLLLQLLIELDSLNHIEFVYGPYIIQTKNEKFDFEGIIKRIMYVRSHFPKIELTNIGNRDKIRERLNDISPVDIPNKDVWGDRSTPKNKFRYVKNTLGLFDFIESADRSYSTPLILKPDSKEEVQHVLEKSNPVNSPINNFYGEWCWIHSNR